MNYRLSTLFAQTTYENDITKVIDLNVVDPISELIVDFAANITDDTSITAHVTECIKKIELVDGSDVLFSLTGKEAEAADWYNNHVKRSPWNIYMGWGETSRFIGINFGRYLWDPDLALDPTKFRNLQLKITLDIDAGGAVPTSNKLGVWAALFDQKKITPVGFLMHKEIKDYAMGASSHEYTDLPTDYPYRKLFVRQQTIGTEPNQHIDKIKLSEDQDKRIVFDHHCMDILRTIAIQTPEYQEYVHARVNTVATNIYVTPTSLVYGVASELGATSGSGAIALGMGDGGRMAAIAKTAQKYATIFVKGYLPHGVFEIPFGLQDKIEDWYEVAGIGSLKADIESGAGAEATDSVQLFAQQFRRY